MSNIKIQQLSTINNKTINILTKRLKKVLDVSFQYEDTVYCIFWSECNNGWMIDIFEDCNENETSEALAEREDYESMLCTGKAKQAVKWAILG